MPDIPASTSRSWLRLPGLVVRALVPVVILVLARVAVAQDLEPRSFTNLPIGLNFFIAGYQLSDGDVTTDAAVPLEDGEVRYHGPVFAYARSIALLGRSAKVDLIVPTGWVSGSATVAGERREREVAGFADPRIRLAMNLYGAPALSLAEFQRFEQDLVVGASLQVSVPLSQYDDDRLVNIGTNRWTFKPEVGLSKTWDPVTVELAAAMSFYTDNDEFLGEQTLEQEPVHSLRSHLLYSFPWGIWSSLDFTWYGGGSVQIDGADAGGTLGSTRIGGTLSFPLGRRHSVKVFANTGATARLGSDFDKVGLLWQYRWGAGL